MKAEPLLEARPLSEEEPLEESLSAEEDSVWEEDPTPDEEPTPEEDPTPEEEPVSEGEPAPKEPPSTPPLPQDMTYQFQGVYGTPPFTDGLNVRRDRGRGRVRPRAALTPSPSRPSRPQGVGTLGGDRPWLAGIQFEFRMSRPAEAIPGPTSTPSRPGDTIFNIGKAVLKDSRTPSAAKPRFSGN